MATEVPDCGDCGQRAAAGHYCVQRRPPQKCDVFISRSGTAEWKETNPKDAEARQDSRVSLSLFPDTAVVAGALAFTEGDAKYGGHNYRVAGVRASVYYDAEERHMKAWRNGEDIDPDSGLPHLWKALACIAVLIDAQECGKLTDDRPPPAPVGDMLTRLKIDVRRLYETHVDRKTRRYTAKT
jgi:hypothetical protein